MQTEPPREKLYWEDLQVGEVRDLGTITPTREEIMAFATQFDPQPFHLDPEAARRSLLGGLAASGWHTCCLTMLLVTENILKDSTGVGAPGIDECKWLKPVRPGDRLRMKMTVVEARPSKSKPDRGSVLHLWEAYNQNGELVLSMQGWGMFLRRNPPPPDAAPGTAA